MSAREAASPKLTPTDLLFLFFTPFFENLCSEPAKRRRPVSPNGPTALCYGKNKRGNLAAKARFGLRKTGKWVILRYSKK